MADTTITENTSIKQLRKIFPDIEEALIKAGYAPVTKMLTVMAKPDRLTLSNVARAAGLTEVEISLMIEVLNERLNYYSLLPGNKKSNKGKSRTEAKPGPKTGKARHSVA